MSFTRKLGAASVGAIAAMITLAAPSSAAVPAQHAATPANTSKATSGWKNYGEYESMSDCDFAGRYFVSKHWWLSEYYCDRLGAPAGYDVVLYIR